MPIFKINNGKLEKQNTRLLETEKELQTLIENNLGEALGMYFLATEYTTTFGGRIDTIAVDYDGAPVIIEYKKSKNDNVINQSLSYLKWLQGQKIDFFEMLIRKKLGDDIAKEISVDWKNPRIICIAESYSKYDMDTVEFIPIKIELFRYRYYDGNLLSLEPMVVSKQKLRAGSVVNVDKISSDNTVDDLMKKGTKEVKEIFRELRSQILELDDDITEKPTSAYVAYRTTRNFAEVHIGKNQIKVFIRPIDYYDPKAKVDRIPDGYNWTLNRRVYIKPHDDLEYVLNLIKQSYKDTL